MVMIIGYYISTWFSYDSGLVTHFVAKTSSHGQSWSIYVLQPDAFWSQSITKFILVEVDTPTKLQNSLSLLGVIRFVVNVERLG